MSTDDPAVQICFRSSTTPESPKPLHVPQPAEIPVLANQIDLRSNLLSTHLQAPIDPRKLTAIDFAVEAMDAQQSLLPGFGDPIEDQATADDVNNEKSETELQTEMEKELEAQIEAEMAENSAEQTASAAEAAAPHLSSELLQPVSSDAQIETSSKTQSGIVPPTLTVQNESDDLPHYSEPVDDDDGNGESLPSVQNAPLPTQTSTNDQNPSSPSQASPDALNEAAQVDLELKPSTTSAPGVLAADAIPTTAESDPSHVLHSANDVTAELRNEMIEEAASAGAVSPEQIAKDPTIDPTIISAAEGTTADSSVNVQASSIPATTSEHPAPDAPAYSDANGTPALPLNASQLPTLDPGSAPAQSFALPQQFDPHLLAALAQQAASNDVPMPDAQNQTSDVPAPRDSALADREFEEFLDAERRYTSEGNWEQFPYGSRLFVGNLPTESINKREVWEIFSRYGKLAQISIKQAYGFVQFFNPDDCGKAMVGEQNRGLKDRNLNLEVSKPPKGRLRGHDVDRRSGGRRRSPSPVRRDDRQSGRQDQRRRDDYRPGRRSPSPYSRRRSPDRYRGDRSRSPGYGRGGPGRYRSPSPRGGEDNLPLPRRNPRDVPDVQIILLDQLDRNFVAFIEKTLRDRGLRVDVLLMPPRVRIEDVVKRQILEGVHAVVKLTRQHQSRVRLPLQVFDHSRGANNVSFDEYDDLEANVVAELVLRAKSSNAPGYGYASQYPAQPSQGYDSRNPQFPSQQPGLPPQVASQPNVANLISSLDPVSLQKLLGAMQQPGAPPGAAAALAALSQQPGQAMNPNLNNLISGMHQQAPQQPPQPNYAYSVPSAGQQRQPGFNAYGGQPQNGVPPQQQQHVQNIMEQLAKWKQ